MGVIKRQTIRGSIYSYLGVAIGFFATGLIMPRLLSTDQIGLINVLIAISALYAQFSTLGFTSVTMRMFSYFRDQNNNHNGYAFLTVAIGIVGFLIAAVSFFILKPYLIETEQGESPLLTQYVYFLLPLIFFRMFFLLLDTYNKMLFDATTGTFLSDLAFRLGNLLLLAAYFLHWINFTQYVWGYVFLLCFPAIYLAGLLIYRKQFYIQPKLEVITPPVRKEMIGLAVFGILGGLSGVAISNLDKIMLNQFFNLSVTGVYSISFYFATIILIPNRALAKISSTVIADAWKDNQLKIIDDIYYKSSINQLYAGLLLFLLLIVNLHNIFRILPPSYGGGEWVIILISLSNLVVVSTGVSMQILATSHKYKIQTYSMGLLLLLTVLFYLLFIPLWGMNGAALASLFSASIASAMRVIYLKWKMNLEPYRVAHLKCLAVAAFAFGVCKVIPNVGNLYIDIAVRSSVVSVLFIGLSYLWQISSEVNTSIHEVFYLIRPKDRN